ncbi:biotin--[acetyl-CoA-carboxylase] ligase [Puerhibacterium sp. TATVAM-FAB25]|uniref:biotin--[acetyl-CoA-carboxylase] ligase n=1 Tax=Puerhibacterium sp. TATVAM-FAB25 TaxID=3093699 RepID=UPI003978E519
MTESPAPAEPAAAPAESAGPTVPAAARAPLDVPRLRAALLRPAGAWERLDVVATSPSTNAALAGLARDPGSWRAPAALAAEHQTAGRGRAGRGWQTPPGAALTVSALLRPRVPAEVLGWLPLLGGLAVVRALRAAGVPAAVKWPNDVLLPAEEPVAGYGAWRKVAGLLAEVVPGVAGQGAAGQGVAGSGGRARDGGAPAAVVLGVGLNVSQATGELPVPTATSLALAGPAGARAAADRTGLLVAVLRELAAVVARWEADGGDPHAADGEAPSLAAQYAAASATLGAPVRAELAGSGRVLEGTAVRLAADGSLVVAVPDAAGPAVEHVVAAGDVHHLRRG